MDWLAESKNVMSALTKKPDSRILKNKMENGEDSCIDILGFKIDLFKIASERAKNTIKTDRRTQKTADRPNQPPNNFSI